MRTIAPFERISSYLRSLSPGDRSIAYLLGLLIAGTSIAGFFQLEQSVLVAVPAYGGTLTEGAVGSPRFVNPLLALSDADRDLTALTYAGLMGEDGNGNLVPILAEEYTVSDDGKTYTFTLRSNAVFSDGIAVTADDVVFTVGKAQDPALKSPEYANWNGVTVTAIDPHTVEFRLAKSYAPFLENTTLGILPAHLWRGVSDEEFPFSTLMTEPIGAGPFVVSRVVRNASGIIKEYDLTAHKKYAPGRPHLSGITFIYYPEESDLQKALAAGTIDSAYGLPNADALRAPYSRVFGVFFNASENPAFSHLEVRKALSIALNRNLIAQEVLGGFAVPLAGPVPPGSGITETPIPDAENRTANAAKILTDAGWTYDGENRTWKKGTETLSVTLRTSNVPELKAVAGAVRDDWETLGVPVSIELYEPGDLTQNVIRPRKYQALLFGMVIGRDRDLYAFWDSAQRNDPGLNIALYTNKAVDELLEKAREESDPATEKATLQKANDLIAADYPAAFTHAPSFLYVIPENLHGVTLPQIASPSDRFSGVATWYLRTEKIWPFLLKSE